MNISLIIPSGGIGSRMNADIPKQYLEINNIPIIIRTLLVFNKIKEINNIIIPINNNWIDFVIENIKKHNITKKLHFVESGSTRAESIKNALKSAHISSSEYVLIHDAVRCLVSENLINNIIKCLNEHDSVIPVLKITDTIKEIKDNFVINTIDRNIIFRVQTPQAFKLSEYLEIIENIDINNKQYSDDASIFESVGKMIYTIDGEEKNIKITTKNDLEFVKYIINKV